MPRGATTCNANARVAWAELLDNLSVAILSAKTLLELGLGESVA
jgi:hypothetical protein